MSTKSKRNRRNIPQNRKSTAVPAVSSMASITKVDTTQISKIAGPNADSSKAAVLVPSSVYFLRDLKWTGVVTAIVIVLLIISFLVFR
jgi:hypothetical protein